MDFTRSIGLIEELKDKIESSGLSFAQFEQILNLEVNRNFTGKLRAAGFSMKANAGPLTF